MFDKRRIRKHGVQAKAEVLSVEERSKLTSNDLRDYDHVVAVRATERVLFLHTGGLPSLHAYEGEVLGRTEVTA